MIRQVEPVHILGVGVVTGWADSSLSLTDLIFNATSAAIADGGVPIEAIESVVLAAHDLVDGRSLSSMVTAPAAGAYLRDEIRLTSDGLAALSLACARVEAGETEYSIVAAWGRASEGDFVRTSQVAFDPAYEQAFQSDEFSFSAWRLSAWIAEHGFAANDRSRAAHVRRERAASNPRAVSAGVRPALASPLTGDDAPLIADIAVAAIVGRGGGKVKVTGLGHGTGSAIIGARDLLGADPLFDAVAMAKAQARRSIDSLDLYLVPGPTLSDEALALETLGLAEPGRGFEEYAARPNVNPGGGSEAGWCYPTCGLVNAVEAYLQLTGNAGPCQIDGGPTSALVVGTCAMGGQAAHAAILERVG